MKLFFVIALLCASVCSFSQRVSGCGYAFQTFAITAGVARAQTEFHDAFIINPEVYQKSDGSWCYSFYVVTLPPPEPLPTPQPVKNAAKAIVAQQFKLNKSSTYTLF